MLQGLHCNPNSQKQSLCSTYSWKVLKTNYCRYQRKKFRKALCPIVERLAGALMFHGRNTGKKVKAVNILKHAFEIVHLLTGKNPLGVLS